MAASTKQAEATVNGRVRLVEGDLLDQPVDAIVNAWNRDIIPWWLLLPQGVSRAVKRRAGLQPFRQLSHVGPIPLGQAVMTDAGRLGHKAIIHVAGINMLWRASERSVRDCVTNALQIAYEHGMESIAMPLIGAGSGSLSPDHVREIILDQIRICPPQIDVYIVTHKESIAP